MERTTVNEPAAAPGTIDNSTAGRVQSLALSEESKRYRGGTGSARSCLIGVFLLVSLAANAMLAWKLFSKPAAEQDSAPRTKSNSADTGLELTGTAIARSQVCVSPTVGGVVTELAVREGQSVKATDLLARLDDKAFRNDIAQSQQLLAAAEARLKLLQTGPSPADKERAQTLIQEAGTGVELAKLNHAKVQKFFAGDLANESDVKAAALQVQQAENRLEQAKQAASKLEAGADPEQVKVAVAEVERAKLVIEQAESLKKSTEIRAPASGMLVRVNVAEGETVQPGAGIMGRRDPDGCLFLIADVSQINVEVDVPEAELTRIAVGRKCRVIPDRGTSAGASASYEGVVDQVGATVNTQRGTVRARIRVLDPNAKLLPGTSCRVVFEPAGQEG